MELMQENLTDVTCKHTQNIKYKDAIRIRKHLYHQNNKEMKLCSANN